MDEKALDYLRLTARDDAHVARIEAFYRAQGMFRDYNDDSQEVLGARAVYLCVLLRSPLLFLSLIHHHYLNFNFFFKA